MRPIDELRRQVAPFRVRADFSPSGDQPAAISELERRIRSGEKDVVLLGATGTGKTATVAWLAERLQRPVLVMQPNKTLAAQSPTTTTTSPRPTSRKRTPILRRTPP